MAVNEIDTSDLSQVPTELIRFVLEFYAEDGE
jgi:hypothetical protein